MKFEEAIVELKKGKQIINNDWNGIKLEGKQMYISLQRPDEHSLNTEPYFMFYSVTFVPLAPTSKLGGWKSKRFPWTPSQLDMFSENWEIRKKVILNEEQK